MVKEKYLPFVEPEKEPEPPKTPQEIRKEKLKNFWDYHKWHVILVVGLVVAIVWTIIANVTKVEPDYTVPVISKTGLPVTIADELEKNLALYADDRNGDGKVVVKVATYELNSELMNEEPEKAQALMLLFISDAETNVNAFYIGDETNIMEFAGYEELIGYTDGSSINENEEFTLEEIAIPLSESNLIPEDYEYAVAFDGMYFAVRANDGDIIENEQDTYDAAFDMFQRILKDEKINEPTEE